MKFIHIADLHFGKIIYGLSMIDDQKDWVEKFLDMCRKERPDAVVIAGDVYDRSTPSGAAVELLDHLLTSLSEMKIVVMMTAGNHDSGQRLAFAHEMLAKQKVHIAGTLQKEMVHVRFENPDGAGPVTFWLMPYLFPESISVLLQDENIHSYDTAVRKLLSAQNINFSERNVIIAHQNVTANGIEVERGGSESMVGGVGEVDYTAFDGFEYAALGHIHSAYPVGRPSVRYAGTPMCYHFEETRQPAKGPLLVELGEKGQDPSVKLEKIDPLHKMKWLEGTYAEVRQQLRDDVGRNEYIGITLSDQRVRPETSAEFHELAESRQSKLLELLSSWSVVPGSGKRADAKSIREKPVEDLFADLYRDRNGDNPPDDVSYKLMQYVGELVRNSDPHEPLNDKDADKILNFAAKLTEDAQ